MITRITNLNRISANNGFGNTSSAELFRNFNYKAPIDEVRQDSFTKSVPQKKSSGLLKTLLIGGAVLLASAAAVYFLRGRKRSQDVLLDLAYKQDLLNSIPSHINVDRKNPNILESIVGKEELQKILKLFNGDVNALSQGARSQKWVQDTNLMTNIENLNYRANLHIHTTHSDGKMSVRELLDQASQYADRVAAAKNKTYPSQPFVIAITDHDSVSGCREAVEIIAQNPQKYKNLRVVLGCELSTYHRDIPAVTPQHRTHLLIYNINPYNDVLSQIVAEKQQRTLMAAQSIIDKMNGKMKSYWDFQEINYNLEEAKTSSWCIREGLNAVNSPLKDYFQFRKIYHECVVHNSDLDKFLTEKGIKKGAVSFADSCKNVTYIHKKLTNGENMPYWNKYLISLKWEILKKLHGDDFVLTPQNYKATLNEVNAYFANSEKNINGAMQNIDREFYGLIKSEEEQISDFTQVLKRLSKDKNISLGIAHPAFIAPYHFEKSDTGRKNEFIKNLFDIFKKHGGENALYYEKVYPYFNNGSYMKIDDEFLEYINREACSNSLIPSGSLDNHGKNLFLTE